MIFRYTMERVPSFRYHACVSMLRVSEAAQHGSRIVYPYTILSCAVASYLFYSVLLYPLTPALSRFASSWGLSRG